MEKVALASIVSLMKWSFEEQNRHSTCFLGGLEAICELLVLSQLAFGHQPRDSHLLLRRYIGMTLTNLTYCAVHCKQTLCGDASYLRSISCQLKSTEDLKQVYASVLRNLSWKADLASQTALRANGTARLLISAALTAKRETTIKSILSALWNVTSHSEENQLEVCAVPSAVAFLVAAFKRSCAANNMAIVENCGGIIRNLSTCIGGSEEFRQIFRDTNCLHLLVDHLRADNVTVVSNACGILWSLASSCVEEQKLLCKLGAVPLLKALTSSKHVLIRLASVSTLKILQTHHLDMCQQSPPACRQEEEEEEPAAPASCRPCVGQASSSSDRPAAGEHLNSSAFAQLTLTDRVAGQKRESFETLKRFAFEGTPAELSQRSSMSSIYAALFQEEHSCSDEKAAGSAPSKERKVSLQSGGDRENRQNNRPGNVAKEEDDLFSPVMFSRNSSVQSLNSCELNSVHSTVYSEYSCYPTALVSPSDMPDSPSQSALVSPCPEAKVGRPMGADESPQQDSPATLKSSASGQASSVFTVVEDVFDQPRTYQNEGSSRGDLSSASSLLSAFTIDRETKVKPVSSTNGDVFDLKNFIRSAQPSRSGSSKDVNSSIQSGASKAAASLKPRRNYDKSPASSPYGKGSSTAQAYADDIVRCYANEGAASHTLTAGRLGDKKASSDALCASKSSADKSFAGMTRDEEDAPSVTNIHSVIHMAMPRPKSDSQTGNKVRSAVKKADKLSRLRKK